MQGKFLNGPGIKTQDSGVHCGTGMKGFGADRAQSRGPPALLEHEAENAVVFGFWNGDKPVPNFLLHHNDGTADGARRIKKPTQNRVTDGIREIADESRSVSGISRRGAA